MSASIDFSEVKSCLLLSGDLAQLKLRPIHLAVSSFPCISKYTVELLRRQTWRKSSDDYLESLRTGFDSR